MTSCTYIIVTDAVPAAAAAGLPIDVAVFVVDVDAPDLLFHPSSVLFKEIAVAVVRVRALLQLRGGRLRIPRPGKKGRTAQEAIKIRGPRERDIERGKGRGRSHITLGSEIVLRG